MKYECITGEWRETCLPFINYLDKLEELPYSFLKIGKIQIPYLDVEPAMEDNYILSFVRLFLYLSEIEERTFYFVFFPRCEEGEFCKKILDRIFLELLNKKIVILFNKKTCIDDIRLRNTKTVTYNSVLPLKNYQDFSDFIEERSGKKKRFLKRSIRIFSNNHDFAIKQINMESSLEYILDLYVQCCNKHDDFMESKKFLENLHLADNVDWYGVYYCEKLVMFTGYWKNAESVVLGMFGKDYAYEPILRKNNVYFAFNLFLIGKAIEQRFDFLFSSYGEQDLKRQIGYEFEDYGIAVF